MLEKYAIPHFPGFEDLQPGPQLHPISLSPSCGPSMTTATLTRKTIRLGPGSHIIGLVPCHRGRKRVGVQADMMLEEGEWRWSWLEPLKLECSAPETHFLQPSHMLQQGHTSSLCHSLWAYGGHFHSQHHNDLFPNWQPRLTLLSPCLPFHYRSFWNAPKRERLFGQGIPP